MTERTPPPPHPAVDKGEWAALIASANEDREVEANNIAHVLRHVELSEELLRQTESVLKTIDITISKVEPDISGPIERVPAPRPTTTSTPRPSTKQAGSGPEAGDAVRMYLHEIGQVDLLSAEDERRLGKAIRAMQEARQTMATTRVAGEQRFESGQAGCKEGERSGAGHRPSMVGVAFARGKHWTT